ncbi:MAG TPA: hypothetical protein DHW78_07215 [Ruminococcaceae bacterium]|nr:hypothetical protein [Oscillospiraceae bacterium]HCM24094.1 hypothetical protein [Oscillospiraceae bacterium]
MVNVFNDYDFYFGAVLSVFLRGAKTHYTPSLISSNNKNGRIYEFAVDREPDFILVMSYASHPRPDTADKDYDSWFFNFTVEQQNIIKSCIDDKKGIKIALMCGKDKWNQSELALMNDDDIAETIYQNNKIKSTVTIRRDKNKHSYFIYRGKSPKDAYQLKAQLPE